MTKEKLKNILTQKRGYLAHGDARIAKRFNVSENIAKKAKNEVKAMIIK
jgi:hypothetical protein